MLIEEGKHWTKGRNYKCLFWL